MTVCQLEGEKDREEVADAISYVLGCAQACVRFLLLPTISLQATRRGLQCGESSTKFSFVWSLPFQPYSGLPFDYIAQQR